MKKKFIIPVAVVAGAVAARMISKRRNKNKSGSYRSSNLAGSASTGTSHDRMARPKRSRRSARRSRGGA